MKKNKEKKVEVGSVKVILKIMKTSGVGCPENYIDSSIILD